MKRAYYAILRYCPDPIRGETANAGVLLVGANTYAFRAIDRFGAVRQWMSGFDERLLEAHRSAIHQFFRQKPYYLHQADGHKTTTNRIGREVLAEFAARFSGPSLCYGPVCRVEGNIDSDFSLQTLLADLFEQFVTRRAAPANDDKKRKERVKTILRNELESCDFLSAEKYRFPLVQDETVELSGRGYRLPLTFSFDNGTLHVIEPVDALEHEGITELREVALVSMIFQKLREDLGQRVRTYAVLVRPPGGSQLRELRILREHAKIVDLSHKGDREAFFLKLHQWMRPRSPEFLEL